MAATNVQAFSGDVEISSNLTAASSKFSLDTNGTLKQIGAGLNNNYIKLMKYFPSGSNWKIATGSYAVGGFQWLSIRAKMTRLDVDVEIIQFNYFGSGGISRVRDSIVIGGGGSATQPNEIKVYNKESNSTYEIYLQIDSATSVEVEITHRDSTIDDDYSTVATENNGAIDETGLTKIYDSGTTTDLRLRSGNVGIGTTDPQDVTHIWKSGANDDHGLLIEQNNSGTGSATLKFSVATTSESTTGLSKAGIFFKRADTNGRGDLLFCMDNADDTNDVDTSNHALTIYRDGNVGIGRADPDCRLHMMEPDDISVTTKLFHTENGFSGGSVGHFEIIEKKTGAGTRWDDFTLRLQRRVDSTEQGYIDFNPSGSTGEYGMAFGRAGTSEYMRITGAGNVGIGRTNPLAPLDIKAKKGIVTVASLSDLYSNASVMITGTAENYDALCIGMLGTDTGGDSGNNPRAYIQNIWDQNASIRPEPILLNPAGGNIGIGTTNPGNATLHIHSGGLHMGGTELRASSAIGTVSSGSYVKLCDFSALPSTTGGVATIRISWGNGRGGGVQYYWFGSAVVTLPYNTYGDGNGMFGGSPGATLTAVTQFYHHRTVGELTFRVDKDLQSASYGYFSLYVAPAASIDDMSFHVNALPLKR